MKKKTILHGNYIIRVWKGSSIGSISLENIKTKKRTVMNIDKDGVFRQEDNTTPKNTKVVKKAIQIYKEMI